MKMPISMPLPRKKMPSPMPSPMPMPTRKMPRILILMPLVALTLGLANNASAAAKEDARPKSAKGHVRSYPTEEARLLALTTGWDTRLTDAKAAGNLREEHMLIDAEMEAELASLHRTLNPSDIPATQEATSDFESDFGPWDTVRDGDFLPYLAPHQGNAQFTLISGLWSGEMSYRYVAAMRTVAGNAALDFVETTDAASIFDAVIRREFRSGFQGYLGVNNLFDAVVVVAKRPAGLRPAMPRLFRIGMRWAI